MADETTAATTTSGAPTPKPGIIYRHPYIVILIRV